MMYAAGRLLQVAGLAAVPVGVLLSIEHGTERFEFAYLILGGGAFLLGTWLVRRVAGR